MAFGRLYWRLFVGIYYRIRVEIKKVLTDLAWHAIIVFVSCADVAQLVEQLIRNEQVIGSNPTISSSEIKASEIIGSFFCGRFYNFVPYLSLIIV